MNIYKFIPIIILAAAFEFSGCDDSGFISNVPQGITHFTYSHFSRIDPNVDGLFELWLRLDSAGNITNYSFGKFNFNADGTLVDTSGNPLTIEFNGDTNSLKWSTDAFITLEPPGDNNSEPSEQVLLSGHMNFNEDSIYTDLKMSGALALGSTGQVILSTTYAYYIINTPTGNNQTCLRGVWLCDTNGNSGFQNGMQLNAPGWVYESWIKDKSNPNNPIYYSMGRFRDPFGPDFDGAGGCAGPGGPIYSKPGQDWIDDSCLSGKPPVQNINNGNYEILFSLEPSNEQPSNPSFNRPFLILMNQGTIVVTCKRLDDLYPQFLPSGRLKITYRE